MKPERIILALFATIVMGCTLAAFGTNTASGIVWEDLDRDGIREPGEPFITNGWVTLYMVHDPYDVFHTYLTNGSYEFSITNNGQFFLSFLDHNRYYATIQNAGTNDAIDSDLDNQGNSGLFEFTGTTAVNFDGGFIALIPGLNADTYVNGHPNKGHYYTSTGEVFTLTHVITNSGETYFSFVLAADSLTNDPNVIIIECPYQLSPTKAITITNHVVVSENATNVSSFLAFPVDFSTCNFFDLPPSAASNTTVFTFVTNNTVTGIVWEDIDLDGIREVGEPLITNGFVVLRPTNALDITHSNSLNNSGCYTIKGISNDVYDIFIVVDNKYTPTLQNVGANDSIDSDVSDNGLAPTFSVSGSSLIKIDGGFRKLVPKLDVIQHYNGQLASNHYYATNGEVFIHSYVITNCGESFLSYLTSVESIIDPPNTFLISCPDTMYPGQSLFITNQIVITENATNDFGVLAFPVHFIGCETLALDPVQWTNQTIFTLVHSYTDYDGDWIPNDWELEHGLDHLGSNAPSANSDGDWMTDLQEFWADTIPTNSESYLPNARIMNGAVYLEASSTNRLYRIWYSKNLTDDPQNWNMMSEKTGTGFGVTFAVSNDAPFKVYRTGVVAP